MKYSSDIWFCAFLLSKGYKINNYLKKDRGKVSCGFEIDEDKWKELKLEFNNSEIIKFKGLIEQIKDLGF